MARLTLRLSDSTHEQLKLLAQREGVSINQLVLAAVSEKLSALRTARYLDFLANPPSREDYEAALSQVPDATPDPWDTWDVAGEGDKDH